MKLKSDIYIYISKKLDIIFNVYNISVTTRNVMLGNKDYLFYYFVS